MSAKALNVYEALRASGIDESRARRAAEAIDENTGEQIAEAEERTADRFVSKGEYSRRMESTPVREETDSQYAELRADNRDLRADNQELRADMKELRADVRDLQVAVAKIGQEIQYLRWGVAAIAAVLIAEFIGKFFS